MCFCSHTFLFLLKSIPITATTSSLNISIYSGAYIKSTLQCSVILLVHLSWNPYHFVFVFIGLLSSLMITSEYAFIPLILIVLEQYCAYYEYSINNWEMHQSRHSFLQRPMMSLHCNCSSQTWQPGSRQILQLLHSHSISHFLKSIAVNNLIVLHFFTLLHSSCLNPS